MYRVTWHKGWDDQGVMLHSPFSDGPKVEGQIEKEINKTDKFTFTMHDIPTAEQIEPIKDLIRVFNTKTNEYDFEGRIYKIAKGTDTNGVPSFKFTCEGLLGYLHDMTIGYSRVPKTLGESFKYLLERHNIMVRSNPEKQIALGDITFFRKDEEHVIEYFEEDDAYEIIVNKLVGEFGGELQLRRVGENLYLDWLDEIGEPSLTPLAIGLNLLSNEIVQDSSELYTIVKPLGAKVEGNDMDRVDISSVNNGSWFIDIKDMQREFGTINRTVLFDDISDPDELKVAGLEYAQKKPVVSVNQYNLKALDLSLKDEEFSSFKLGNSYVLQDYVLRAVNEVLRVIKITIDINSPQESNVTIGDKITDLNEYQNDRGRLADDRHRQNQRKFNQLDLKDKNQDGLIGVNKNNIETNRNNISTNSHNIGVNKERIDAIVEWRDGFIERYNDLVGIVNDLVANQTPPSGGGGGTDSNGYANNRVFPVDYNRSGINFWTKLTQPDMGYGDRSGGFHSGWDIGGGGSSHPIYATTDGVVRKSEFMSGGIGNAIYIEHTADDFWSNYMHLASMSVSVGQTVKAGQRIGTMGNTGGDYAIHLHYELSPNGSFHSGGNTINPQAYLGITGDNKTSLPRPV